MAGGRGPAGGAAVAVRGPRGYASYSRLPAGSNYVHWHGGSYWNLGFTWYQPYYYAGTVYYSEVPAPAGYVVDNLPDDASTNEFDGNTYYYYNSTYYIQKDGKYEAVDFPTGAPSQAPSLDPKAMEQLQRMAAFLSTVKAGRFVVRDTSDEILDSGQKVQVESTRSVAVRAPDRMAVDFTADGVTRRMVYDGKTVTVFEKDQDLYAQQAMPPTLPAALDELASKYGIALPAAELLRPGLMDRLEPQMRSAEYIGPETVDGDNCQLVTFSLDWADVQIWIQDGDKALPRRAVIAYKKIPSTPKYVMSFNDWDLSTPPDSAFELELPSDATRIEMTPLAENQ
jgi:hypothetical protein